MDARLRLAGSPRVGEEADNHPESTFSSNNELNHERSATRLLPTYHRRGDEEQGPAITAAPASSIAAQRDFFFLFFQSPSELNVNEDAAAGAPIAPVDAELIRE